MVLIINKQIYSRKCSLENLAEHNDLIHYSYQFASTNEIKQPLEEISKTIYVYQREFAVLANNDPNGFHLIGSDDATTCHILILDNQIAVALGHLDGGETRESIEQMLKELEQYAPQNTNYDVYLVGGFLDQPHRQHSRPLSNEILDILSRISNITFHLKLAAITPYNDHIINNIHYPMIYGVCFDINTKILRKMNFIDFGPAFRLRTIYQSTDHHCAWCIYTSSKGIIEIKKFQIDKNLIKAYYRQLYKYYFHNDQQLLAMTSTSPEQERISYVTNVKKDNFICIKIL